MADVAVTVMVDGKQLFVHAVAGVPDAEAAVAAALSLGSAHFQAIKAAAAGKPSVAKPQDNSL